MWDKFDIGFWHPFGAYTGQSATQILEWKRAEIGRFGWTFWSFVYSSRTDEWLEHLASVDGPVYVLCSHSPNARDPDVHRGSLMAHQFRYLSEQPWQSMPGTRIMRVTNPFKRRGLALGFKVSRIIEMEPIVSPFGVEWYSRGEQKWRSDKVPTRGEFLIRRGGTLPLRRVCAVLELAPPYLAELRHDPARVGPK